MNHAQTSPVDAAKAFGAVADWYHAYFTGIVLSTVTRLGAARADELVYEVFSRQRRERFLPGLQKLGLAKLPHAVAAAQYHYLSNHIGGVAVEYMYESDRKAWIRYAAPRWIWAGTALCGIPSSVSRSMLAGWHAQNGLSLGNPRLGFVCTKQTTDGQSGLEGYYLEYDHALEAHERLRFAPHEDAPDFDPSAAPILPISTWPQERLSKAHRNYAMEYVRTAYPTALALWGPDQACQLLRLTGRMIGMQHYHQIAASLGLAADRSAASFAQFIAALAQAQGDRCEVQAHSSGLRVHQSGWKFMEGIADADNALASSWNGLIEGALAAHNHRLGLSFKAETRGAQPELEWLVTDAPGRARPA